VAHRYAFRLSRFSLKELGTSDRDVDLSGHSEGTLAKQVDYYI